MNIYIYIYIYMYVYIIYIYIYNVFLPSEQSQPPALSSGEGGGRRQSRFSKQSPRVQEIASLIRAMFLDSGAMLTLKC